MTARIDRREMVDPGCIAPPLAGVEGYRPRMLIFQLRASYRVVKSHVSPLNPAIPMPEITSPPGKRQNRSDFYVQIKLRYGRIEMVTNCYYLDYP